MDLTEMLANLMLDLKMTLDDEISTDEATRCIVRSVDDMSRTLPRERIYEHTWVEAVTDDSFVTPAATNDDSIVAAAGLVDTEDGDTLTLTTTWMDIPRPVVVTLLDDNDSILRMTVIVKGTDANGVYREERFYRPDFVPITGAGDKVQTGKIYFLSVSEVEVNEIYGSDTNDTLDVGTSAGAGIWVQLDNPIEPGSESIYSALLKAGTKYTLDTDYHMDYANGRIQIISAGSMVVATTYYANYDRAPCHIDISSIIPELIRITKVLYPADKIPEQSVAFGIWENMLTLGSLRPGESQQAMTDKEHVAIYYEAKHAPPTEVSSGSYPEHLDQVVLIGAAGYALLVEALEHELLAADDIAEMRTTLGYLGIGGVGAGALTLVYKAIDDALDKVALYLETNVAGDSGANNADAILIRITTDKAQLREAISKATTGALEVMNGYLDSVATADLDLATYGATALISTGQPLINQLNDGGPTVPERYADFSRTVVARAQARVQAAMGYAQEAQLRLSNLRSYIEEAGGWMRMGETFIAEASQRIAELNGYLAEAAQYLEASNVDMVLSDRFRAEGQIRLAEFHAILSSKAEYRKRVVSVPVRQPS